jgi:hypothetical protein
MCIATGTAGKENGIGIIGSGGMSRMTGGRSAANTDVGATMTDIITHRM